MGHTILAAALLSATATAQTKVPGDPYDSDPVSIVADPCPTHPKPTNGWQMYNLHMLTRDHGQLCRYAAQNAAIKTPVRVVFIGDSITDNWVGTNASLFTNGVVDRSVSGQTTSQMLIRFRNDVMLLHPKAAHIMAGTNDIAGNTGAATMVTVEGDIASMADLAHAHGIKVILASVPPAAAFPWSPAKRPVPQIADLNIWLRGYAKAYGYSYVDYLAALTTHQGGMKPGLSTDGVHPTPAGYAVMKPLPLAVIADTLGSR
jgi:lysophospholipase L1-like esterase